MEKAKIVLDALQGVKSNGVWRDYESDDGLDYRRFNWKDLIFFVRLEQWNNDGEIIIFWSGIDNLGLRQWGISSGQPVSEILPPLQTCRGGSCPPPPLRDTHPREQDSLNGNNIASKGRISSRLSRDIAN